MVECYLLTHFTLSATDVRIKILLLDKDRTPDFRTSRCAGYLLDHSGDETRNQYVGSRHERSERGAMMRLSSVTVQACKRRQDHNTESTLYR